MSNTSNVGSRMPSAVLRVLEAVPSSYCTETLPGQFVCQREFDLGVVELFDVVSLAESSWDHGSLDDLYAGKADPMAGPHLLQRSEQWLHAVLKPSSPLQALSQTFSQPYLHASILTLH